MTGSSRGIGRGIADELAVAGAKVVYHGHEATDDLPQGSAFVQLDLLAPDAAPRLIEEAFAAVPELDILVCNAGSFFDTPYLEMSAKEWAQTMDLNVRAPYFLVQAFAKRLEAEKRGGSVIIISSTNGFQAEPDSTAYDTSKGALVMMTRTLAVSLAPHSIRVNSIAPGLIRTPLTERWLDAQPEMRRHYERNIPLGRIGMPKDCADSAVFLASEASSYMTGQTLILDGGLTLTQIGPL